VDPAEPPNGRKGAPASDREGDYEIYTAKLLCGEMGRS